MRLAIADPPYLGRARALYGDKPKSPSGRKLATGNSCFAYRAADEHPDAHLWDDPATHQQLVDRLVVEYDGWALAMAHDNLRVILPMIPARVPIRVAIWVKKQPVPGASRVHNYYEPVVIRIPEGRRAAKGHQQFPRDAVTIGRDNAGFIGTKPAAWTRWVLDLLGYQAGDDTVDDLFPGSGAVSAALAQGVLL